MEFSEWVTIMQLFTVLFGGGYTIDGVFNIDYYIEKSLQVTYISIGLAAGIFVLCLVLGGIALNTMAKKEGIKPSPLAYIPFANTYFAGKIAGESNFFGQKMKRAGLYAMLAEIITFLFNIFYLVTEILSLPYNYQSGYTESGIPIIGLDLSKMPSSIVWLVQCKEYITWLSWLTEIIQVVFMCVMFIALFRKYFARRPVLMTLLSAILPFRAFVLFAVRKNTPVDYNDYLRRRADAMYRNYYNNPYNGNNDGYNGYNGGQGNYGGNGGQNGYSGGGNSPFDEFGGSSGSTDNSGGNSPFDDFN